MPRSWIRAEQPQPNDLVGVGQGGQRGEVSRGGPRGDGEFAFGAYEAVVASNDRQPVVPEPLRNHTSLPSFA